MDKITIVDGLIIEQFYNSENNRVIKLINNTNSQIKVKILFYMSSVLKPVIKWSGNLNSNTWFIPQLKTSGLSHFELTLNDDSKYFSMMIKDKNLIDIEKKVVCVGLNKTGTTSILKEMEKLDFKVFPKNNNEINYTEKFFNNNVGMAIDIMEKSEYTFFKDIPWSCPGISEKIIKYTPNSKFILSVRDTPEQWIKSVKNFWSSCFNSKGEVVYTSLKVKFMDGDVDYFGYLFGMFESWNLNLYDGNLDDKLYHVYINHYNSVKKTLIQNNCDWIEINVSKKGELKKMTDWLGIKNDKNNFEHINKGNYGN